MKKWVLGCLGLLWIGLVAAQANPYVILPGDRRMEGVSIRARRDGTVLLTNQQGQEFTFAPGDYVRAVASRPSEFDEGIRFLRAGRHDDAISRFQTVVERYRHLSWDEQALIAMARAYVEKGDGRNAVQRYEELFRINPDRQGEREVRWGYMTALQTAGRRDDVLPKIEEMIREGDPSDAARAYIMRGSINKERNRLEDAVLDYLRAVMFFQGQREAREQMPEAYLGVAQALEKMRDNRSREWYRNVLEEFPNSPQAETARSKL